MGSFLKQLMKVSMENDAERMTTVEDAVDLDNSSTPMDVDSGENLRNVRDVEDTEETDDTDLEDTDTEGTEDQESDDVSESEVEETTEESDGTEGTDEESNDVDESSIEDTDEESDGESDESEEDAEPTEEDKEEAKDALESIYNAANEAALRGGLTEGEAMLATIGIECITKRLKLKDVRMVASVESFSEKSSKRLLATNRLLATLKYYIDNI